MILLLPVRLIQQRCLMIHERAWCCQCRKAWREDVGWVAAMLLPRTLFFKINPDAPVSQGLPLEIDQTTLSL